MRPLVFSDTTAEIIFWTSMALWMGIELGVHSPGRTSREWTVTLVLLTLMASLFVAGGVAYKGVATIPGSGWWPVVVGLTLLWAGVAYRLWAVLTLGRYFKVAIVVQEGQRVVDQGPYRWVRHPSYTGGLVTLAGIGLAYGDWISLVIMIVFPLIALLIRIHVEEGMLLNEMGDEYAAYSKRTARLVPGVY